MWARSYQFSEGQGGCSDAERWTWHGPENLFEKHRSNLSKEFYFEGILKTFSHKY